MKLLLQEGADAAAGAIDGITPLAQAAVEGHIEVVKLLLAHLPPDAAGAAAAPLPAAGAGLYSQQQLVRAAAEAAQAEQWRVWSLLVWVVGQCFPGALGEVFDRVSGEQVGRALLGAWREDMAGLEEQKAGVARKREEVEELRRGAQQFIIQGALLHKQVDRSRERD